eukprot:GHVR01040405.1.p1 GENE.GHVR01040405.1~~GHVR01040405.1.p1  ORF type:complete len:132 (-),score=14.42 GHVR01040405.1:3301-3696(-)
MEISFFATKRSSFIHQPSNSPVKNVFAKKKAASFMGDHIGKETGVTPDKIVSQSNEEYVHGNSKQFDLQKRKGKYHLKQIVLSLGKLDIKDLRINKIKMPQLKNIKMIREINLDRGKDIGDKCRSSSRRQN